MEMSGWFHISVALTPWKFPTIFICSIGVRMDPKSLHFTFSNGKGKGISKFHSITGHKGTEMD